jgi:hypothetical protein
MGVDLVQVEPHLPSVRLLWFLVLVVGYPFLAWRAVRQMGPGGAWLAFAVGVTLFTATLLAARYTWHLQALGRGDIPDLYQLAGIGLLIGIPSFGLATRSVFRRTVLHHGPWPGGRDVAAAVGAWSLGAVASVLPFFIVDVIRLVD